MYCYKCGNQVSEEYVVCPYCGCPIQNDNQQYQSTNQQYQPVNQQYQPTNQQFQPIADYEKKKSCNSLGIASIICAFFVPLIGLICGILGISKCKSLLELNPNDLGVLQSKKLNVAGIVISIIYLVICVVYSLVYTSYYFMYM